jgi:hypothetical protein
MGVVKPVVHSFDIHPEGKRTTVNPKFVALRPIGDGVKYFAHVADLKGVVVISSLRCHMATWPHSGCIDLRNNATPLSLQE